MLHPRRAAAAAVDLAARLPALGLRVPVRIGVASGRALVGNVGGHEVKSFSAIGAVFSHALLLERLTRRYGASVLATRVVCQSIPATLRCRYVDLVQLPAAPGRVFLLGALQSAMPVAPKALNATTATSPAHRANLPSVGLDAAAAADWGFFVGTGPGDVGAAAAPTPVDVDNGIFEALWSGDIGTAMALNAQRIAMDDHDAGGDTGTEIVSQTETDGAKTAADDAAHPRPSAVVKPPLQGLLRRAVRNTKRGRGGIVCSHLGAFYNEVFAVEAPTSAADRLLPDAADAPESSYDPSQGSSTNTFGALDDDDTVFVVSARRR
uniref:Guanylate cyclase domain-containing protein n=1 Tax=Neobodo designis TaxID=312471 RepID=A0A7S1R637_NEODS